GGGTKKGDRLQLQCWSSITYSPSLAIDAHRSCLSVRTSVVWPAFDQESMTRQLARSSSPHTSCRDDAMAEWSSPPPIISLTWRERFPFDHPAAATTSSPSASDGGDDERSKPRDPSSC